MANCDDVLRRQHIQHLYVSHHGWLREWLRRQLQCRQQSADLAQDAFVRLLSKGNAELAEIKQPRAYLRTVAKGLLYNHWRRRQIEVAYLEALAQQPAAVEPSPESRALIIETLMQIDQLLGQLPGKVRQAFLMSQLEGLGYAVIATRLGVSERMVKKYMAQAMLHCLVLGRDAE
ncbi:sigma-70 family RNA polymerase sigma factor [Halopseudomonas pelagia]|uniref:sigma-70 family RNA polymerase sigma factor n=1 Tax=Halopseudomonas pelagia TaxID=553151 RepID=UPI00039BA770|nr:sigma-70 family RNA polymerase sigma factor [Halopseudomonas pelagia]|tara:strand:+ start:2317 stop:2841 length:525 start_codon:yes stop_codon:yes gene_type:complete